MLGYSLLNQAWPPRTKIILLSGVIFTSLVGWSKFASPQGLEEVSKAFACAEKSSEQEGKVILGNVEKAYGAVKALKAKFQQVSYLASLDERERSEGSMHFRAAQDQEHGVGMRWDYLKPEPQTFLIKGSTVWFYQALDKQVIIDNVSKLLLSDAPVAFLLGVAKLHESFKLTGSCKTSRGVALTLKDSREEKQGQLDYFTLLVDPETWLPIGAEVIDLSSNKTTILFDKLEVNGTISAESFKPSWPRTVDVIDRR
jgi:outer membrane lipoprotein-sorting protein